MLINKCCATTIIGLVACEPSGDNIGANLMYALRNYLPNVYFVGIGGMRMKKVGMESWYNIEELTVMGIFEVIKHLPRILLIRHDLINRFIKIKPDVFIGIDAPDFTIAIESKLKQHGIRTIHYVSPSIWAWRPKRVSKIGRATDNILVCLPFEKKIYDRYNIPCQFVGHTLADVMPLNPDKIKARLALNIPINSRCLVLMPGSRRSEIAMLSSDFLLTAKILIRYFKELEIIVPLVNLARRTEFEYFNKKINIPVRLIDGNQSQQAMIAADVALLASGTASLECMLAKCPMVVGYRVNNLTFALVKKMIKTPWISLPNLIAGKKLITELLQNACQPEKLANHLIPLFDYNKNISHLLTEFYRLHQQIRCNADKKAANAIITLIKR